MESVICLHCPFSACPNSICSFICIHPSDFFSFVSWAILMSRNDYFGFDLLHNYLRCYLCNCCSRLLHWLSLFGYDIWISDLNAHLKMIQDYFSNFPIAQHVYSLTIISFAISSWVLFASWRLSHFVTTMRNWCVIVSLHSLHPCDQSLFSYIYLSRLFH